jgi:hypothetical protein
LPLISVLSWSRVFWHLLEVFSCKALAAPEAFGWNLSCCDSSLLGCDALGYRMPWIKEGVLRVSSGAAAPLIVTSPFWMLETPACLPQKAGLWRVSPKC